MVAMYNYFNMGNVDINFHNKLYSAGSVEDALMINTFMGEGTIEVINSNFTLFTTVAKLVLKHKDYITKATSLLKD